MSSVKNQKSQKPDKGEDSFVLTALSSNCSSHPQSLKKQGKWWFAFGLMPIIAVLAIVGWLLTGTSGWKMFFVHPTIFLWIVGGAFALSLGLSFSFLLLNLVSRSRLSTQTSDPDALPFSRKCVVIVAFFWVLPAALSFIQVYFGVRIIPQQMIFVLNILCIAPFILLLVLVSFATSGDRGTPQKGKRRSIWFILGTLFLGLAGFSLFGDIQGFVRSIKLPSSLSGLSALTLRAVALLTLLPLSMVCYAVWNLFRRTWVDHEGSRMQLRPDETVKGKSIFRCIWEKLCTFAGHGQEGLGVGGIPPSWLKELCSKLPEGVSIKTSNPPQPDRLPSKDTPVSPASPLPDADPLWVLMGAREGFLPTQSQVRFFDRFRNALEEVRLAADKGNSISPDLILSGEEGSGRTESLLAAAIYAAFARRQRVLYLVADGNQAEELCRKANQRFKDIFLDSFLRAKTLDVNNAAVWVGEIKSLASKNTRNTPRGEISVSDKIPPNILFATPRDMERIFFEGCGIDADSSSVDPLRELLRLFEVVLVDDFSKLDVNERAHLPFLLHKLRLILVSGNLIPQFVVVTPRLQDGNGVRLVADRFWGSSFKLANKEGEGNAIELLPRECNPTWIVKLVCKHGLSADAICENLVMKSLGLTKAGGENLRVILYCKGIHSDKCRDKESKLEPNGRSGRLKVVSRLEDIDSHEHVDAVFCAAPDAGQAGMSLRLACGGEDGVYFCIFSQSYAVTGKEDIQGLLPTIPDSSAVALRIHHLRSVLRFVTPGQPLDVSVWERFGVSISSGMRIVDVAGDAIIHEKWRQDEWKEPKYGQPPLWPYIAFEGDGSVKSNGGRRTDFGVFPYTDEDVARLGSSPMIGLVRPKAMRDGKEEYYGVGASSLAKWIDDQGAVIGAVDLAHAQTLVLGRSALGDVYTSLASMAESVFTVETFEDPNLDDHSCVCQIKKKDWKGDGEDYDTPARTLAWRIEPISLPQSPDADRGRAFMYFELPDCRDLPRVVSAWIEGMVDASGHENHDKVGKPRAYSYPAYFSGLLIAPRRFDNDTRLSQIQRGVAGTWDTRETSFSVVLSHILTGVLRQVIADFSFYSLVPVFHERGKKDAIATAIAWFVQPLNSGRTIEQVVKPLFIEQGGVSRLKIALQEARMVFEACPDDMAKLRWLRSFSKSPFSFNIESPGKAEEFSQDVKWSLEVLDVIDSRISGGDKEIEEFRDPVPEIVRSHTWMSSPKTFDVSGFLPDTVWTCIARLPVPPALGRDGVNITWHYGGKRFSMSVGFREQEDRDRYGNFFDSTFKSRIVSDSYVEYGYNDPYREFVCEISKELRKMMDREFPEASQTQLAEFLLAFVQEGLPFKYDPKKYDPEGRELDWPRHPSEMLMHFGGDCEDSSILYAELLRLFGIDSAILTIPRHAAVGVDVPMSQRIDGKQPVKYTWLGKDYVYAETACDRGACPLGSETKLIPSAKLIQADIIPTPKCEPDPESPVRIVNAVWSTPGILEISIIVPFETKTPLAVVVFARPHKMGVFDAPNPNSYTCVGGSLLPILKPYNLMAAKVNLSSPDFSSWWLDVFVCDPQTGNTHGHFVGVTSLGKVPAKKK